MFKFRLLLPEGGMVSQSTVFNSPSKGKHKIQDAETLCRLLYNVWRRETNSKNYADWANELNESGDFESTFTEVDAFDNMCNLFLCLEVNGSTVNIADYFKANCPKLAR